MGIEIEINTLDEMCALMCDNAVFEREDNQMESYAQEQEDLIIARILKDVKEGFYIDIGAYSPDVYSVTKLFYEQGWRGINIEPIPDMCAEFTAKRERDINLNIAISNTKGAMTLHVDGMASTLSDKVVAESNLTFKDVEIEVDTLTNVVTYYAPQEIHFLKVDVEGFEKQVLEGYDFHIRPWVICMESTKPNTEIPCYDEWEYILLEHGYALKEAHGINRFYVDAERNWG